MKIIIPNITLAINLLLNLIIFYITASIYILPKLNDLTPKQILTPILLLNWLRHLWIMFISPWVVLKWMPVRFSYPAALWDFISAILAIISIYYLYTNNSNSKKMINIFNIFWFSDFVIAIFLSILYKAWMFMWWAYRIPSFRVPMLLISHYIIYIYNKKYRK